MIGWVVELSEYQIQYQTKGVIKSQALANFAVKLNPHHPTEDEDSQ